MIIEHSVAVAVQANASFSVVLSLRLDLLAMFSISELESKFKKLELEAANLKAQWRLKTTEAAACYKVLQRLRTESAKTEAEEAVTNVKQKVKKENSSSSSSSSSDDEGERCARRHANALYNAGARPYRR